MSLSGDSEGAQTQLRLEVKALSRDDRQKLLGDAGVTVTLDATQCLTIKSELALPWYRLRILHT